MEIPVTHEELEVLELWFWFKEVIATGRYDECSVLELFEDGSGKLRGFVGENDELLAKWYTFEAGVAKLKKLAKEASDE